MMGGVTAALGLDAVAIKMNWVDDGERHVWVFIGFIFAHNANLISWIRFRLGLHWTSLLAIPMTVTLSSVLLCGAGPGLFHAAMPLFSIHALLCWLAATAFRIPDWYGDQTESGGPRVFSLQALMGLTLSQAVLFLVLKYGDFDRIPPWGFVLLIATAITSWLLGCSLFTFPSRKTLLVLPASLAALCTAVKLILDRVDIGQSESDARMISFEFLIISFLLPAFIGFAVRFRQKKAMPSDDSDGLPPPPLAEGCASTP